MAESTIELVKTELIEPREPGMDLTTSSPPSSASSTGSNTLRIYHEIGGVPLWRSRPTTTVNTANCDWPESTDRRGTDALLELGRDGHPHRSPAHLSDSSDRSYAGRDERGHDDVASRVSAGRTRTCPVQRSPDDQR